MIKRRNVNHVKEKRYTVTLANEVATFIDHMILGHVVIVQPVILSVHLAQSLLHLERQKTEPGL